MYLVFDFSGYDGIQFSILFLIDSLGTLYLQGHIVTTVLFPVEYDLILASYAFDT